ncbi:MAG TPA: hypothetical protein EYG85_09890 [Crocinitomix sp.]|nr:hypothetical protein [Crocinitomix sp.]
MSTSVVLISWAYKLLLSLFFYWVMVYYYGNGSLYGDAGRFINNAKSINAIAYDYPLEYIKLLFGFADFRNPVLQPYLEPTQIFLGINDYDYLNDNRLIIKVNSLIYFISKGNVFTHLLIHSFLGFLGCFLIYKSFKNFINRKQWFWWGLTLLPSIAFWGGGITKSSILLLALGLFFYALNLFYQQKKIRGFVVCLIISGLLLIFNKPYVGFIIISLSILLFIGYYFKFKTNYIWGTLIVIISSFFLLIYDVIPLHFTNRISLRQKDMTNVAKGGVYFVSDSAVCYSEYNYLNRFETVDDTMLVVKKSMPSNYKLFGTKTFYPFLLKADSTKYELYLSIPPSKSFYEIPSIDNSATQLLKNSPQAIFDVIVRPFPWDNGTSLKIFAFVQNIILLLFIFYALINTGMLSQVQKWLLYYLLLSTLFLALLIGLTTPVFGAMVRYKMPVDLLILIISFILLKPIKHETN